MKKLIALVCLLGICHDALSNETPNTQPKYPQAVIHTTLGDITVELYPDKAPVTVANFLDYASSGFYDGTIFHRVIQRFMIQGGGMTKDMVKKPTKAPIVNESKNGLHNDRWTLAMARTADPDSATSQFYINVSMNYRLDPQQGQPGYAVFGMVIDGKHVVKAIEKTATQTLGMYQNVPVEPIVITGVDIKK